MAASPPSLGAALLLVAGLSASPLASQVPLAIDGRIVREKGGAPIPVAGAAVTLHRVSRTAQGAVDSVLTLGDGRFRFSRAGDTTAVYLVSARYAGIEYFGPPIRPPGKGGMEIAVSDTSSMAPIRLASRRVIIRPPDESGTRLVIDLFSLTNAGPDTRVGRDTLSPTFEVALPAGILQPEVQEGDISPTAIRFAGDTMQVLAPLAPGQKNVMVSYRLPDGVGRASWLAPADSFDVMLEEGAASVTGAGLESVAAVEVEDNLLHRWTAVPPSGGVGTVQFGDVAAARKRVLAWLVGFLILALGGGVVLTMRRGRQMPGQSFPETGGDLIEALARLDARYAGRQAEVGTGEWAEYQAERGRLKAAALARARTRR